MLLTTLQFKWRSRRRLVLCSRNSARSAQVIHTRVERSHVPYGLDQIGNVIRGALLYGRIS